MTSKTIVPALFGILFLNVAVNGQTNDEVNKKIVMRYFDEVLNKQRTNVLAEIFHEQYLFQNMEDGSESRGIQQLHDFLPHLFRAFPDIHYTVKTLVAEDSSVAVQALVSATHQEEFWGFVPSGNKVNVAEVFFYKVRDGKIVECRRLLDFNTFKNQITGSNKQTDKGK